jgi:hypothetical protein
MYQASIGGMNLFASFLNVQLDKCVTRSLAMSKKCEKSAGRRTIEAARGVNPHFDGGTTSLVETTGVVIPLE